MHRRGEEVSRGLLFGGLAALLGVAAFVVVLAVLFFASGGSSTEVELPTLPTVAGNADTTPTLPATPDFYPEESNLGDCLGLVERPGCGSESRGGWRQTIVFGVLAIGVGIVTWRISVGVRQNRRNLDT